MTDEEFLQMRREMGWSQYFLADALGITRARLCHWESGRAPVPPEVAKLVRRAHRKVTGAARLLAEFCED